MKQTGRGERVGKQWGLIDGRGRDQSKNTCEGPVDMDNGVGVDYESGRLGMESGKRGKVGTTVTA